MGGWVDDEETCIEEMLVLLHCPIAPLPHCLIASLPHCPIAPLPHCLIASLPHCLITPLPVSARRLSRPFPRRPSGRSGDRGRGGIRVRRRVGRPIRRDPSCAVRATTRRLRIARDRRMR